MPIYSFSCNNCGHQQDHLLKMSESLSTCPNCKSESYTKQITAPGGFSFKGNGFYQTDFKTPCGADAKQVQQMGCGGNCSCH